MVLTDATRLVNTKLLQVIVNNILNNCTPNMALDNGTKLGSIILTFAGELRFDVTRLWKIWTDDKNIPSPFCDKASYKHVRQHSR